MLVLHCHSYCDLLLILLRQDPQTNCAARRSDRGIHHRVPASLLRGGHHQIVHHHPVLPFLPRHMEEDEGDAEHSMDLMLLLL